MCADSGSMPSATSFYGFSVLPNLDKSIPPPQSSLSMPHPLRPTAIAQTHSISHLDSCHCSTGTPSGAESQAVTSPFRATLVPS